MKHRGVFITFEGGEGAGKTTLIEKIVQTLEASGHSVLRTREPGGTALGEEIRSLLLKKKGMSPFAELALFLASRAEHIQEVILPALEQGKIVLCDRFNDSSIAYQGFARGLGVKKVEEACQFFSKQLTPDLTLYLDIDPKEGLRRARTREKPDRIEAEGISFHQKIREGYLLIERENQTRFHRLDASLSIEAIYEKAMMWVEDVCKRVLKKSGH